jgi:hypothetical protein
MIAEYDFTKITPLYLADCLLVRRKVACFDNLILVNSFNEWHEDTQIEPAVGDTASYPVQLTAGLQYEGYGELYLNILRQSTVNEDDNIFDN